METADATVHHFSDKSGLVLVPCCVDDLLTYSQDPAKAEEVFKTFSKLYKMKQTGILRPHETGTLEFLGRVLA